MADTTAGALSARTETVSVAGRELVVHVAPLGPATLVVAVSDTGVLACGAVDPGPLGRLGLPAARVRPTRGPSIASAADLFAGVVTEANDAAVARGVVVGMTGEAAAAIL